MNLIWQHLTTQNSKSYTCGFCNKSLASEKGYHAVRSDAQHVTGGYIYICHYCHKPTFFNFDGHQTPGHRFGEEVNGIDDAGVESLYDEARDCFSQNAFTATVLSCRKLLMHIAVAKGAEQGLNFINYVEFLSEKGYVPPDAKGWVDHIRSKGNEANHEIVIMSEEEAKDIITFIEMLLKLVYEFPAASKKYNSSADSQ